MMKEKSRKKAIKPGSAAVEAGQKFEKRVEDFILSKKYAPIDKRVFQAFVDMSIQNIYTSQYLFSFKGIDKRKPRADFLLYNEEKYPNYLIIEAKSQYSEGTAYQKIPFLVENIIRRYPIHAKTIIVADGILCELGVLELAKEHIGDKLTHVFDTFDMFVDWANDGGL